MSMRSEMGDDFINQSQTYALSPLKFEMDK